MKPPHTPKRRVSPAIRFREQIETAVAGGAVREELMLRLTLGDASLLRRDRDIAVTDISFTDGVMRFLGVRIVEGGVVESELVSAL